MACYSKNKTSCSHGDDGSLSEEQMRLIDTIENTYDNLMKTTGSRGMPAAIAGISADELLIDYNMMTRLFRVATDHVLEGNTDEAKKICVYSQMVDIFRFPETIKDFESWDEMGYEEIHRLVCVILSAMIPCSCLDEKTREALAVPLTSCRGCNNSFALHKMKRCSRCEARFYCSKPCQKNDWKSHKPYCQPIGKTPHM
jgi:hypothetical protein